jgi:protein TonB
MPAPAAGFGKANPRERLTALAAVLVVQLGLALALLSGLSVRIDRQSDAVERLIAIALPKPPPPPTSPPLPRAEHKAEGQRRAAPKAAPVNPGRSPGPRAVHLAPRLAPIVALQPAPAPSGGGAGAGAAAGTGSGGGAGGNGDGDSGEGGTDLVQIAGAILPSDYPRDLRERGVGGQVGILFTVGVNGRVTGCTVTRSSGVAELDELTCRLIRQRFVFRPGTDSRGRPVADQVEGEHDWVARR